MKKYYLKPLEKQNNTFSFVSEFNSTYSGSGENILSIKVIDFFGDNFYFEENITSKILTYNENISESGEIIDPNDGKYQKSTPYPYSELIIIIIPSSVLAIFLIIALLRIKFKH